jgi:thiol:disulfide interchange protein
MHWLIRVLALLLPADRPTRHDTSGEEWRVYFQAAVADIKFFKEQQWKVTNYALLLDAALVAIENQLQHPSYLLKFIAVALLLALNCYGLRVLKSLIAAEKRARDRTKRAIPEFTIGPQLQLPHN